MGRGQNVRPGELAIDSLSDPRERLPETMVLRREQASEMPQEFGAGLHVQINPCEELGGERGAGEGEGQKRGSCC